jgi:hypothetical protein
VVEPPTALAPQPGSNGGRTRGALRWGAIALGVGLDIGTTQLCATAISMVVGFRLSSAHPHIMSEGAAALTAMRSAMAAPSIFVLTSLVGLLCSAIGGFLTAYLAKTRLLLNATVMGLCSAGIGLLSLGAAGGLRFPEVALAVATVPAAMLGGQLAHLAVARGATKPGGRYWN